MKVMVSNPMLKVMKQTLKDYRVTLEKFSYDEYKRLVDYDALAHTQDYDGEKFKCFRIEYPAEYYAAPQYITTQDLTRIFRNSDGTFQSFQNAIVSYCAI